MKLHYIDQPEINRLLAASTDAAVRTALLADACRLNTLYMIMRAGSGHIGSSFSAMDLVSWLYLNELKEDRDVYFSSKGHDAPGLYSVLLALGRLPFGKIHELRRLGGLPGHPDVATPGMPFNTGSLGMGISKAKGMVLGARLSKDERRVFVLTGDGELQEGQIWESLQGAANRHMGEITVIVDHNKIQSDTWVDKVSPLGDLEKKFAAFGWEVARCDGHDFGAIRTVLERFRKVTNRPKILIADTTKGKGVSFMEKTSAAGEFEFYKFHSGAPSPDNFAAAIAELRARIEKVAGPLKLTEVDLPDRPAPAGQRLVANAYSRAIVAQAEKNPKLVALDADLVLDTGLIPFSEKFPDRFIECGIAEMDMVSSASGLAREGYLPVVHSFACFLTPRANEHIYNNATERSKIIYVGSLAGTIPGGPGHSHQSVRDIAILAQIPGLALIEPCCENEVEGALDWAVNHNPLSTYIRLTSIPVDIPFSAPTAFPAHGTGSVLREGSDVAVIGYGPVPLTEAWHAAEECARQGTGVRLINLPWLNHVDPAWLRGALKGVRRVVTLDNHYRHGGQGDMIARALAENGLHLPVSRLGLDDVPACGTNPEVLAHHTLCRAAMAAEFSRR